MIRAFIALMFLALPVQGEEIIAALSQNKVGITASFNGSEILVFGAIKHDKPSSEMRAIDVIITISGPPQPVTVRRKEKVAGIWVNTDAVEVDEAPSFYAVAASLPLNVALNDVDDLRHKITINRAIRSVGAPQDVENSETFTEALIRIRKANGLYQVLDNGVTILDQTLFRSNIALPANLVEGVYETRVYSAFDGEIVGEYRTFIDVRKVGIEAWIYNLAHRRPLIYGLLSLTIAIIAGWGASTIFRYVRG